MVIDTSALFAIEFAEPEQLLFATAIRLATPRLVSAATAVECVSVFAGRRPGADPMIAFNDQVHELGLRIEPLDDAQWREAARAIVRYGKGRHPARLNLGDAFSYALAKVAGEPLLFKGGYFALTDIASAL